MPWQPQLLQEGSEEETGRVHPGQGGPQELLLALIPREVTFPWWELPLGKIGTPSLRKTGHNCNCEVHRAQGERARECICGPFFKEEQLFLLPLHMTVHPKMSETEPQAMLL